MSDAPTPEELDAQIEMRRSRFATVVADIRKVLQQDLALYVPREVKRAYLSLPEVAEALGADDLKALKRRAVDVGAAAAARVGAALADLSVWAHDGPPPANPRDLSSAAAWEHVVAVSDDVQALLSDFGLGAGAVSAYKPPAYFVKGHYLPSLAEHYWRLLQEIDALTEAKVELARDAVRARLETRWEDA